jgi:DNA-binding response OmpR family regulator
MPTFPKQPMIFLVGNDSMLAYLLQRYAEQSNHQIVRRDIAPSMGDMEQYQPTAVIFTSVDQLQADQAFVEAMSAREIPVLVCASVADEARAMELGADECLLHPLTYSQFCAALPATCSSPEA